ncbi:Hypothetical protein CINCED_3A007143 [Cinara cedri]|uniref:Uncharacterized protein n=1 Tax=Cinara cedri TaxID=506608 RepID=A0A5E4N1N8_9HEMI|nr:Hypothetical protein CINCED_3A007143 [Cinara cedri]
MKLINNKINGNIPTSDQKYVFDFEQYSWDQQPNTLKCDLMKHARNRIECERQNIEKNIKLKEAIQHEQLRLTYFLNSLKQLKMEVMDKLKMVPDS